MIRRVWLTLILVLAETRAFAQSATPVQCVSMDSRFVTNFNWAALTWAAAAALVIPLALSHPSIARKWWWTANSLTRWLYAAVFVSLMFTALWILLPIAGLFGWVSGDAALLVYGTPSSYYTCTTGTVGAGGSWFWTWGSATGAAVTQWVFMPVVFTAWFALFALIYRLYCSYRARTFWS